MSIQRIEQYYNHVERAYQFGGSRNETTVRKPFHDLLEYYARLKSLEMIGELDYRTRLGNTVRPDGTLKDALRQDWGYWESKDDKDDLDQEIATKFAKGYPQNNILFEDSQTAVLVQGGAEIGRVPIYDAPALDQLLTRFVSYESREVREFREAIENFARDVPELVAELRNILEEQAQHNEAYQKEAATFLALCQKSINKEIQMDDVREMIIQHVLTQDIFVTIFDEPQFHQENIIAHRLGQVVDTFFVGTTRRNIHGRIAPYYNAIKARAAQIYNHHEKQRFLKVVYERFYQSYNPKAADRLGIVYTPNEIVRFMIQAADTLCWRHFGKGLGHEGVDILDPATGTGTFITELIEYLPKHQLAHKYQHEIHCNEVGILPYYIANLNIEFSYKQKMGAFVPFENIVFVDTLDNTNFTYEAKQYSLAYGMVEANAERIRRQNARDISVVIGNPPYNAWQENFNMQNPNRPYLEVDKRIRETYIKEGNAQNQIAVYDMYVRFLRWATDRLGKNGVVAFVSNNSFVDALTFDGFRKVAAKEFNSIYILNLKGNARTSGERRKQEGGNIFTDLIRVGVAIYFLVKDERQTGCKIFYDEVADYTTAEEKLAYVRDNPFSQLPFKPITPSPRHAWINQTANNFDDLLPLVDKQVKAGQGGQALFRLFSAGVKSQRDEWVYDFSPQGLERKMRYFVATYQQTLADPANPAKMSIKWDRELTKYHQRGIMKSYNPAQVLPSIYRPFVKMNFYFDKHFNGMTYQNFTIFPNEGLANLVICFSGGGSSKPFHCLAIEQVPSHDLLEKTQCLPLYRYDKMGNRGDNITTWGLAQFQQAYQDPTITKEAIFHYVYAVLHHPAYLKAYGQNLKRDFPRVPFYAGFWQWAGWGQALMGWHIGYETADPYPLTRHETDPETSRQAYKAKLKADKKRGTIEVDTLTTLGGVPAAVWGYKLGNYAAVEWVLERYKERKVKDPTLAAQFDTYRLADYKEQVIDLLARVVTVSLETMAIVEAMPGEMEVVSG